jgi:hypothetical protein
MSDNWPSVLPLPSIALSYEVGGGVVSNQMESGIVRQRQRFSNQRRAYSVKFTMDEFQLSVFEAFVKHSLAGGAGSFNIKLPLADQGLVETESSIINGEYSIDALAANIKWSVSFNLIVQTNNTLTPTVLAVILSSDNKGQDYIDAATALHNEMQHFILTHPM